MLPGLHTGLPWPHVTSVALSPLQTAAGREGIHWAPGPRAGSAPEGPFRVFPCEMRSTVLAQRGTLGTEAWTPWQMSRCECCPTGRGIATLLTQDTLVPQQVLSHPQRPRLAGFLVTSAQCPWERGARKGA